jgi:hypothetical protein
MRPRVIVAAVVILATTRAAADPVHLHLHMRTPSTVTTDGGTTLKLPPGYFLDEDSYGQLDTEMRRLQEQETRLGAENRSLRKTLSSWQPGWLVVAGAVVGGVALGFYVHSKL